MPIGYKYAEREADSQINWAEVGRGFRDVLEETNRVREEKKAALDEAQREAMNYIAETPNGEHVGARQSILDFADQASNQMRIVDNLLKAGIMQPKDYTIFRQNLIDNTNLAFNANKAYQEEYANIMQRARDGISSGLELNNAEEVEGFGNWNNIGWHIAPNGVVMAGKMVEQEVDGKKVRTLDKTPGGLRSMNYLNQAILGRIDKYDYLSKVKEFVGNLGEEKKTIVTLGKIQQQGKIRSVEDITSRKDIDPATKQVLFDFIKAENEKIKEIAGTNLDSARILYDSAKTAPNMQPYTITTNPEEAKKGENYILKVVDPDSGGFTYQLTDAQKKDAEEFIRTNMRAQYDYKEEAQVVGAVARDPEPQADKDAREKDKEASDTANMIGKLWYGDGNQVQSAIDYFKGIKNSKGETIFKSIERDKTGVTVQLADGTTEKISFLDANNIPRSQEDFIRSAGPLLAGQLDINKALEKGSYNRGAKFNEASSGKAATITPKDNYKNYILNNIKPDFVGLSETEAVNKLKKIAAIGGFELEEAKPGFDAIEIKIPNGKGGYSGSEVFELGQSDSGTQQDIYDAIVKFMVGNASDSTIKANLKGSDKTINTKGKGSKY